MAKGKALQSIRAYLQEQEKAIDSEILEQMRINNAAKNSSRNTDKRSGIRHH